jgi:hypothetical protein
MLTNKVTAIDKFRVNPFGGTSTRGRSPQSMTSARFLEQVHACAFGRQTVLVEACARCMSSPRARLSSCFASAVPPQRVSRGSSRPRRLASPHHLTLDGTRAQAPSRTCTRRRTRPRPKSAFDAIHPCSRRRSRAASRDATLQPLAEGDDFKPRAGMRRARLHFARAHLPFRGCATAPVAFQSTDAREGGGGGGVSTAVTRGPRTATTRRAS